MSGLLQTVILGLLLGGVYALAGVGMSLIYGVMGIINFAAGALLILGAFLAWMLWSSLGLDPLLGVLITAPVMFVIGWLMYSATIRPIRAEFVGSAVLVPFGLWLLLEGLMGVIWGNDSFAIRTGYADEAFRLGSIYIPKPQLFGCLLALAVFIGLEAFLRRTRPGRAVRAAARNPEGAELVGINVGSTAAMTFALGVGVAAIGGAVIAMMAPFVAGSGGAWLGRLLAIVALGGLGSLTGTAIAGIILGLSEALTAQYVAADWTVAVPYVLVFVLLLMWPQGLRGARLREDVAQ